MAKKVTKKAEPTKIRKKTPKKGVKKVLVSKKQGIKAFEKSLENTHAMATAQMETVEGKEYWKNRIVTDKRRDWYELGGNWIEDYKLSVNHPHRQLILNALAKLEPFAGVVEIGCNAGPNLKVISEKYPETQMAGVDVNEDAIIIARDFLPKAILKVGEATHIPFEDKSFDVAIADAVLIYVSPNEIHITLNELNRVARKAIILCEWGDESLKGVIKDEHWARDYRKLLEQFGFKVEVTKITQETWPNKSGNWARNGYVFVAVRA